MNGGGNGPAPTETETMTTNAANLPAENDNSPAALYEDGLISLPEFRYAEGFITETEMHTWTARLAVIHSDYNGGLISKAERKARENAAGMDL
jgi:hypothetical protein